MNDPWIVLLMCSFVLTGVVIAAVWGNLLLRAAARRDFGEGGPARANQAGAAGAGRVMLGAAFGVALGAVIGCGGLLGAASAAGSNVSVPEEFGLFLLAIPVGIVVCPGLALWGLVAAWRVAERDSDDHGPAAPPPPRGGDGLDALDAPFDPPRAGPGGGR